MKPKTKWFKIDLSKNNMIWDSTFLKSCKENKCVFEAIKEDGHQVILKRYEDGDAIWICPKKYGEYINYPHFHSIKIDDNLFKV